MSNRILELAGLSQVLSESKKSTVLAEAKQYEDSSHFESDVSELESHLKKIKKIIQKKEMLEWIKATDSNFGTKKGSAVDKFDKFEDHLLSASSALDDFYKHMVDVSEE